MKTTSYEISRKLAEAGFKTNEENQIWNYEGQERWSVPAFDFETILEALPSQPSESFLEITMLGNQALIGYEKPFIQVSSLVDGKNESLADTAARLWLKLNKEGLV